MMLCVCVCVCFRRGCLYKCVIVLLHTECVGVNMGCCLSTCRTSVVCRMCIF